MNRTLLLGLVVTVLIVAAIGVLRPDWIPGGYGAMAPRLAYWTLALLLVSGAGFGFWRFRRDGGNAALSLLIWVAIGAAIALAYYLFN